jgi:hypothetical protein
MPLLAMALLAALVPPGVLWGDEPNGYDVLEYHLQIPREWYEAGRVTKLGHNVFSYFPQGVEMLDLLAMELRGGPWEGMYLAQLMHVGWGVLAVMAVYAGAAALASKAPATLAGVAAATVPWATLLAPIAYNESGLMLYGALAMAWAMRALTRGAPPDRWKGVFAPRVTHDTEAAAETPSPRHSGERELIKDVLLAGACAGFACGVKLTAGPILVAGLPVAAFVAGLGYRPIVRVTAMSALFVVVALLVFSPWMVRNVAWARNPVFPEAQKIFGHGSFSPTLATRWKRAHSPTPAQQTFVARVAAVRTQLLADWRFGYVFIPLALLALVLNRGRPEAWLLGTLLAVQFCFWVGMTHLQGRFFVLAIGFVGEKFMPTATAFAQARAFGLTDLTVLLPSDLQDVRDLPALELVGDAKAFLYPLPMTRLRYRTVFDIDAKPDEPLIESWLGGPARPEASILIDPPEIARLSMTYYGIPALAPNSPGYGGPPFLLRPQQTSPPPTTAPAAPP